ncbi:MAG: cupin [Candidatus Taylorbacteria bacterium RIFCSPHIGHO2_01_FULL_44_110]|uniref:Cupin n=1 Tax=Candidatus Taylorbacteria bacterium RIFCSPHIGHO2_12_FULL_45_16 TaxID=1802315 RepID=A0A1G2MXX0_9BACT|nr:MAG: cupin [Candidatus Taylorbacteria bacterium RIFCSPHIGHO2_01_FULL_44_110]OHA28775.1 MAG: cupin [Candidatus Taylorbacteria bacterium RIFCSPHIGHO2_12_FULL_45_16]OHA32834.1 MAG: cupin [Candidatus Taylorbacteria bacterium RIFCSPLOWO2_01_FULL_45_59]OHA38242.1 MAG: cupin [Candidatus Taylorbacteria bacterium RIFCSPLOWO2_02_FULL_45_10b]OHA43945.1 MAG: cupin [Candidatus Taylorbacteria bacterium RIFCSPLOWO2_12_FULL_44_9]
MPYFSNIELATLANENFRTVIYTAEHSQIVLMSLQPGEEIGVETHAKNDQFFRFEQGTGKAVIAGHEYAIENGTAILVPAGMEHNIINTGQEKLKMYTIYAPAHHIDKRVHVTKVDAEKDAEDEAFES